MFAPLTYLWLLPLLAFRGHLADRTNGRAIGTVRPSSSVCDVMYCG